MVLLKYLALLESPTVECLWTEIRTNNNKFLLAVCYRPPDARVVFWENLQYILDLAKQDRCKHTIITGDFNSDPLTPNGTKLSKLCSDNNLTLHIQEPTRITEDTSTTLDQFITNIPELVERTSVLPPVSTNDHCTITLTIRFKLHKPTNYKRHIWEYKRADFHGMNNAIKEYDWNSCFDSEDIDEICQNWTTSYLNIAREFIPNKEVVIRPADTPWFNSELRKLKKNKDRLHHRAKSTNSPNDWATFRALRNNYTNKLREAEQTYKHNLASSLKDSQNHNPKKWWHIVKSFMGNKKSSTIPPMVQGNKTFFNAKDKANAFNEAFLSYSKLDDSQAQLPELTYQTNTRLKDIPVAEGHVRDILKGLDVSKATGPDGISARMLKETFSTTALSLTRLIQISLQKQKIPKLWKEATVIPIHKKDSKSEFSNYRPVSLLSIPSKICEKVVFKHMYNYIRDNNLITIHQSGFTQGDSTIHQLLYLYDTFCKALDDKKDVRIVFCDQSKAFDRVWHKGLLHKLQTIGIDDSLLEWFKDYLSDRRQRVGIDGSFSDYGQIQAGVPQGSILGPLLFLIHINDITANIHSEIKLFADDTSLFITLDKNNSNEKTAILNNDLEIINKWAKTWMVTFNPQKTKSLYITLKTETDPLPLTFDGHQLQQVPHHKHLGLIISEDLSWKDHIDSITSNANKKLNILAHLKHILDRKTLRIMYESFIRPSLEYGSIIYCNETDLEKDSLEKVQRRAARIISGGTVCTSLRLLYEELAMETLDTRQERQILLMFHKIIHDNTPSYLQDIAPKPVSQRHRYNHRRPNDYILPKCRLAKYQKSFFPLGTKTWNNLPHEMKLIDDFEAFKTRLLSNIQEENKLFHLGSRHMTIVMAKLRLQCSELNADLYRFNLTESPNCSCGYNYEDAIHYLLECPRYTIPRASLHQTFAEINNHAPFTVRTLLFGHQNMNHEQNKSLYLATIKFVKDTERFKAPKL